MSKGNTFENDVLNLFLRAQPIANLADNASSSPLTNLYAALHTADPGEGGDQTTSEVTYTDYDRVAIPRTTGGWSAPSGGSSSPAANIDFPVGSGGSGTATHWSLGTAASGAGKILWSGPITPNIVTGNGIQPRLTTATTITED